MADQAINALSTKTAPETSDQLLLVGTGEPQLIDYDKLADAILNKITSKNYALDAGTMTLPAALNALNGKTLINAYMGTGLQRDYVLNGLSTYIFFMSFVGDGSIVSTFFAVITTGNNASKTGKILWVGNSAENYVSLTDGVTLHLHITSSIWIQCALAKV